MSKKKYNKIKNPTTIGAILTPDGTAAGPQKCMALKQCAKLCMEEGLICPKENADCRHWIDYKKDNNCSLCTIEKNDCRSLTLRETAERLDLSFVRIKQIEDAALKKIRVRAPQLFEYLAKDDF
jgi:hypothetical protein